MAQEGGSNIMTWVLLGVGAYLVYEWYVSSTTPATGTAAATPGTTPTMTQGSQPTSVSTAPSSTPSSNMTVLAASMAQYLGQSSASADGWDYAFTHIKGNAIDATYNFSFDAVYGPVVNNVRSSGNMSALAFLQMAAAAVPGGLPGLSGLSSAIVRFPARAWGSRINTWTAQNHPLPHNMITAGRTLRGMGAISNPSGFEKALWAGYPLRSNRIL